MKKYLLREILHMTKLLFYSLALQVFFVSMLYAEDTMAQSKSVYDVEISLDIDNASVLEIIREIEAKTNFIFTYNDRTLGGNRFSVSQKRESVGHLLEHLSREGKLHFRQIDQNIHVKKISGKKQESIEIIINDVKVSGRVQDSTGEPIPGVSVLVEGTTTGTITDTDGNFNLDVRENAVLIFSFVGYTTQTIPVSGQSIINVVLKEDITQLSEVVIVGYGTQKKRDLTGSVASVGSEEIGSMPVPSVSDAIQGRASGVQVISSGVPGSDATFRVRGIGTINNSNPLLVINGVPVESGLNQLNPNDIESIQVLKDASAAAIYGSRGANGVIIVKTKSGKAGENRLNFDYYTGFQQATNMVEMLNASEFAAMHNEMMQNGGLGLNPDFADPAALGEGTNWLGEIFKVAPMQNFSASYSGGNEKSTYHVSANLFDQEGIIINTGYKRYSLQFNSEHHIKDRLKFGNSLTLNHDAKTSGNYNIKNTLAALPTQPVFKSDGTYAGPTGQPIFEGDILNPVGQAKLIENETKGYNIIGSIYGDWEIINNLNFRSTAGLQANFWDSRTWAPAYDWEPTPEPDAYLFRGFNKSLTWLWDNTLTYDRYFAVDHHLTALLGVSAQSNRADFMNGSVKNFPSDVTQQLTNGSGTPTLDGNASEWALLSYFTRINYAFSDKYLVTGTVRYDGSSRFGENNKFGIFPSGAFAWRLSNEDFFSGVEGISDLKLRVGYGLTGNQQIGNYAFAAKLQTVQYAFNGQPVNAVAPTVMPNPNVQWETVEQANVGIDATLWNDRITVALDAYIKNTKDMLVPMDVPVTSGYSDVFVPDINAGKMRNKGVELNINSLNVDGELSWSTDFNISYNHNRVISLNDSVPLDAGSIGFNYTLARIQAGHPVNSFFGYLTNGLFQREEDVRNHATQVDGADPFNRTSAGDIRFMDLNDDGVIDDGDRNYIGNPNPEFIFAMNNSFDYKGFDLSIFLQGIYGSDILNANRIWGEAMAVAQNQTVATRDRWTGEGTSNAMPRAVFNDPNKNARASDRYIEDGSYLRIKNVTLGYTLPQKWISKAHLQRARLYTSVQNLFTFTNYSGFDPEVPANGIDFNVYPVTRTISFGVNLSF